MDSEVRTCGVVCTRIDLNCAYIDSAGGIAPVIMKLRPLLQIQWPAPPPAARRSNGPAVRRAAHAPPRSSPPMRRRRAAPTANFPAAVGRRPAGETRCVSSVSANFSQ